MTSTDTRHAVRRVLIVTLIFNLVVALGKITLGFITGALAITADGFHSLTDGAGNIAGLVANVIANQPPDADHPYGHQRFETMAALLIGALLLLTAWELVQGVIDRLRSGAQPQLTPLAFIVLIATLIVNIIISRYQIRAGERLNSQILLADAKNTSADVYVTLAVLVSTGLVAVTGWVWVDVVAAAVVVGLIAHAAWEIVSQTGRILVDTAPYSPQMLTDLVRDIPHMCAVQRARSRGSRALPHIDIDVCIAPETTTEQTHSITYAIRQRLQHELGDIAEIEVHFVPHHPNGRNPVLTARAYADARGLSTHEVDISDDARGTILEMHVEVSPRQTLAQAHEQVSQLEADVIGALPHIDRVITHIEPRYVEIDRETRCDWQQVDRITSHAELLLMERYPQVGWHDVVVRPLAQGYAMNLHGTLPAQTSLEHAHTLAESAETTLRTAIPQLQRVTIHTEPYDHD